MVINMDQLKIFVPLSLVATPQGYVGDEASIKVVILKASFLSSYLIPLKNTRTLVLEQQIQGD